MQLRPADLCGADARRCGRFAPSPTGALHLGSAAAFVVSAVAARAAGERLLLRVEDLDAARNREGATPRLLDDLRWFGIPWDEGPDRPGPVGPYVQSERTPLYDAALDHLAQQGLLYYCDCSRADIRRAASAPHAGEETTTYPGTCRGHGLAKRAFRRPPAVRLRVPAGVVSIEDARCGALSQDVERDVGDYVLRRGDGAFAYQLAVVVDDLAMGVTTVVRADDLLSSAPRQAQLASLLGGEPPRYLHLPMVVDGNGDRLSKRAEGVPIADQRATGRDPRELVRAIAIAYGARGELGPDPFAAWVAQFDPRAMPDHPIDVRQLDG